MNKLMLIVVCLSFAGCAGIIADSATSSYPKYSETQSNWKPVTADKARLVIYMPEEKFNLWNGGLVSRRITLGKQKTVDLTDRGFFYTDIPPGTYNLTVGKGWFTKNHFKIDVAADQITFIRIIDLKADVIAEKSALMELADIHLIIKKPVPYDPNRKD